MSCPSPEALALWLDDACASSAVGAHIDSCLDCHEFVEALRSDQALIEAPLDFPESSFAEIRMGVRQRVACRGRLYIAVASVASVVAVFFALSGRPTPPFRPAQTAPPAARTFPEVLEPRMVVTVKPSLKRKPGTEKAPSTPRSQEALIAALDALYEQPRLIGSGAPGQTVIELRTDDPQVTILLIGDGLPPQGD